MRLLHCLCYIIFLLVIPEIAISYNNAVNRNNYQTSWHYVKVNNHQSYISTYDKISNTSLFIKNDNNKFHIFIVCSSKTYLSNEEIYNCTINIGDIKKTIKARYTLINNIIEFFDSDDIIDILRKNNNNLLTIECKDLSYSYHINNIELFYPIEVNNVNRNISYKNNKITQSIIDINIISFIFICFVITVIIYILYIRAITKINRNINNILHYNKIGNKTTKAKSCLSG